MARQRHWLWYAYLAVAAQGGRTEPQGRELLKATFPEFANLVDPVVSVFGDTSKLNANQIKQSEDMAEIEEAGLQSANLNAEFRAVMNRQRAAANRIRDDQGRFASDNPTNDEGDGNQG